MLIGNFRIDYKMFKYFKKDFYKYFLDEEKWKHKYTIKIN
jgi:hypothetical protein